MPDMNMQIVEEVRRHQLVTEFDIQSQSELDDYQVKFNNVDNPTQSQDNLIVGDDGESLSHWNESVDFDTWIKTNIATSGKRGLLIHGNIGLSSESSGDDTFIQYHGASSSNFHDSNIVAGAIIYESDVKATAASHNIIFGVSNTLAGYDDDSLVIQSYDVTNLHYVKAFSEGTDDNVSEAPSFTSGTFYKTKIVYTGSVLTGFVEDDRIGTSVSTGFPDENMGLFMNPVTGTMEQNWSFLRKYTATEPTVHIGTPKNISTALKSFGRSG